MSNTTNFSSKSSNVLYSQFIVKQVIKNNYLNDSEASSLYSLIEDNGLTPRKIYDALFKLTSMTFEGLTGTCTWSANGEVSKTPKAVIISGGVYVAAE